MYDVCMMYVSMYIYAMILMYFFSTYTLNVCMYALWLPNYDHFPIHTYIHTYIHVCKLICISTSSMVASIRWLARSGGCWYATSASGYLLRWKPSCNEAAGKAN